MEPGLFRKSSLERIASPERLHEYIKITHVGVWAALLACLALLIAVGFWGFYGNIPETVSAFGIIFPEHGVTTVIPSVGGRISNMRVRVGDFVEAGQILAVIPQDDLIRQINQERNSPTPDQRLIDSLIAEYESGSLVLSPVSGLVLSAKSTNETITSSEAIVTIAQQKKYSDDRQLIGYIPVSAARKLHEGMEVQVSPDFAPREEYGFMYGHITSVGTYPISAADVLAQVGNEQYARSLLPEDNSVEIRVTLTVDSASANKLKWSNRKGEDLVISIGTPCRLQIVVKNYRPYELIL